MMLHFVVFLSTNTYLFMFYSILFYCVFVHRVSEKNFHSLIGYKLRNSCLILIIFDTKIPHII